MYESFLIYRRRRYLVHAAVLTAACVAAFVWRQPVEPPSGGTWLGYTLGTIGALLIVWLSFFGLRKRAYASTLGGVEGWLSAHVYFGVALLIIATLHSAGELGLNVHTLAYLLMCTVIGTGIYGVYLYRIYPRRIAGNLDGLARDAIRDRLLELERRGKRLAQRTLPEVQSAVASALERTAMPRDALGRFFGRDGSQAMLADGGGAPKLVRNADQASVLAFLSAQLAASRGGDQTLALRDLVDLFAERRRLLALLRKDTQMQTRLRAWLYVHLPLTFALLAALTVHVITVFLYW